MVGLLLPPSQVAALAPGRVMAPSTAVAHHNSMTLLRLGVYSLLSSLSVP